MVTSDGGNGSIIVEYCGRNSQDNFREPYVYLTITNDTYLENEVVEGRGS